MSFATYTAKGVENILKEFTVGRDQGLSSVEVRARQVKYGANEIRGKQQTWLRILGRQFISPFIYLLVGAAVLAFIFGEMIDGTMIIVFVLINALLGFYQEFKSEKTVHMLNQFVVRKAKVLREGKLEIVEHANIVPGDIVSVEPGDFIPADIRFISQDALTVNESVLTGESVPVQKTAEVLPTEGKEIFEANNIGFSGTTVMSGQGIGVVFGTGKSTVIGDIAHLTEEAVHVSSFEKGITRFSRFILRLILVTLVFVFIANVVIKGGKADIGELIIFSIALAVSVIPEALPVVTTFSLSRGALHLAKNKVVVKRLSAIEDLGSIEILCTDKTGTITENKLTVADHYQHAALSPVWYGSLGSLHMKEGSVENPFDTALTDALTEADHKRLTEYACVHEVPFDPLKRRNLVIVERAGVRELISRGAAEEILKRCKAITPDSTERVHGWIAAQGKRGCRVIAVARVPHTAAVTDIANSERDMEFIGLIAFHDPLKQSTLEALQKAKSLGVRVKILTGDSAEVAGAVGFQVGLAATPEQVMTGEELERLSPGDQHTAVETYSVFARVSPQQKYNIIKLLQEKYEVGFLGEGINDAPALKIANVALVVDHASDIAREAADIVLLKQSLKVVIDGVQEGRRVFANTMKYIRATLTSNFGNFYAIAIASLIIDFLPMLPLQILLVNLLSDFPMIAVAADTVDDEELRAPKQYQIKEVALLATLLGVVSTVFDFIFFGLFYRISPSVLQTNWFIGSILTELILLFSIRTYLPFFKARRPSHILLFLTIGAAALTILLPFIPFAQRVFSFSPPTLIHMSMIIFIVLVYFCTTEIVKLLYQKNMGSHSHT